MKEVKFGAIKFKSIKAAVKAAQKKHPELSYMTVYMRVRSGKPIGNAIQNKPRKYVKKIVEHVAMV